MMNDTYIVILKLAPAFVLSHPELDGLVGGISWRAFFNLTASLQLTVS